MEVAGGTGSVTSPEVNSVGSTTFVRKSEDRYVVCRVPQ